MHIQNHLLPGRESKEKGEGIFKLLIKVKMHLGSFKCNTFRCERRASFMCVRRHTHETGSSFLVKERCYETVEAVRPETGTNTVIPGCLICLSMFVCPLTSQGKYPPAPSSVAAQPSQHGQDSRFGCLYCSSCYQQTWGCLAHPPDTTRHGICTSHHPFHRIMEL